MSPPSVLSARAQVSSIFDRQGEMNRFEGWSKLLDRVIERAHDWMDGTSDGNGASGRSKVPSNTEANLGRHIENLIYDRLLPILPLLAVALAGAVMLGTMFNYLVLDGALDDLNAGLERSLNNWITVVATFSGALAAFVLACVASAQRRLMLGLLTGMLAFLSLDDLLGIHERVGGRIGIDHVETLIFAPVYALALTIMVLLAAEGPARVARYLRAGAGLLVAAVVIDLFSSVTRDLQASWPQQLRIAAEEACEVAGWVLVAGSLLVLSWLALLKIGRTSCVDSTLDR